VRGFELKKFMDETTQEIRRRIKNPIQRRRESRTVLDHKLDPYLFKDIKINERRHEQTAV